MRERESESDADGGKQGMTHGFPPGIRLLCCREHRPGWLCAASFCKRRSTMIEGRTGIDAPRVYQEFFTRMTFRCDPALRSRPSATAGSWRNRLPDRLRAMPAKAHSDVHGREVRTVKE